jgi:transposase
MVRLTDEQWDRIRVHLPEEHIPEGCPGHKPVPTRKVLEAGMWILNSGAQWHMLPQSYPSYRTVNRRFLQWHRRLLVRWEYYAANFPGFVKLASIVILLRQF